MKGIYVLICLSILTCIASAKSFSLTSVNEPKPFGLRIYCTLEGKAAFVQYNGQKGFIPLHLKKFTESVLSDTNKQPEGYYYAWDEILNCKVTGSYTITEHSGKVTDAWYLRGKDGHRFKLIFNSKDVLLDNVQKYLLHGVLITFPLKSIDYQFMFTYPDGRVITPNFLSLDVPDVLRSCYIKDYNFDGYDDLAFSLPDPGMGVYHTFNIWLYDPATKRFQPIQEPSYASSKCSCLCELR